jgi:site-specific DNA-methyltransferase (adenine-specific)
MTVHYSDDDVILHHGDCLDVMAELPDQSVDAVVTDPPYGLDFMGKKWDTGAVSFDTAIWRHALRVLKPGGHLLAFGGTRTWHRLAAAIEDAGFEIRDSIAWLYGSGFPKSLDVSKAIDKAAGTEREVIRPRSYELTDGGGYSGNLNTSRPRLESCEITAPATDAAKQWQGWGTALKPAFEPIVVARKPIRGTVAANVLAHGTGALNIDATRVAGDNPSIGRRKGSTNHLSTRPAREAEAEGRIESRQSPEAFAADRPGELLGRWPTNVVIDEHTAAGIDVHSGVTRDGTAVQRNGGGQRIFNQGDGLTRDDAGYGGGGGASRFFPTFRYEAKAPTSERPSTEGVAHPTVKPLDLMRWLVRLVTPPGGVVLDPFAGSGTTAEAAIHEHMRCIVIERELIYLPLIVARLSKPMAIGFDFETPA